MTSEVAVMNRLAVALAADSAATVGNAAEQKVWNSANKLFALSKHEPIGVMVFNEASLLGAPWETIIKIYREELGGRFFETTAEYAAHFIEFLNKNTSIFPEQDEILFANGRLNAFFEGLTNQVRNMYFDSLMESNQPKFEDIAISIVNQRHKALKARDDLACLTSKKRQEIVRHIRREAKKHVEEFCNMFSVPTASRKLLEISSWIFTKDYFGDEYTGVVIAGFGKKQHFPSLYSYKLGGMTCGVLRYRKDEERIVSNTNLTEIVSFAQDDMIMMFLTGIHPNIESSLLRELVGFGRGIINSVIDANTDLNDQQKTVWRQRARGSFGQALRTFISGLMEDQFKNRRPIESALVHLPKDELAHVAESLVNLNSFQKRVSLDAETVGGPIDVAVISKGDGLVWIKRKHYFEPNLNYQFFANYYGRGEESR